MITVHTGAAIMEINVKFSSGSWESVYLRIQLHHSWVYTPKILRWHLLIHVPCCCIHSNQKLEIAKMSIN